MMTDREIDRYLLKYKDRFRVKKREDGTYEILCRGKSPWPNTDSLVELSAYLMAEQIMNQLEKNPPLVMLCMDCGTMTSLDKNTMAFFCPKCHMNKPARPQTVTQYLEAGGKL